MRRYYGYLWSQVFSADMFESVFAKDPMDRAAGQRYRREILQPGGSRCAAPYNGEQRKMQMLMSHATAGTRWTRSSRSLAASRPTTPSSSTSSVVRRSRTLGRNRLVNLGRLYSSFAVIPNRNSRRNSQVSLLDKVAPVHVSGPTEASCAAS